MNIFVKQATFLQPPCFFSVSNLAGKKITGIIGYIFFSVGVSYQINNSNQINFDLIQPNEDIILAFDGPSVPKTLTSFASPLTFLNEAIVHDYLYSDQSYDSIQGKNRYDFEKNSKIIWNDRIRKKYADDIFNMLLSTNSVISHIQKMMIFYSVRNFGKSSFRNKMELQRNKEVIKSYETLNYYVPKPPSDIYKKYQSFL
ncbi:hypothetical protein AVI51_13160 [Piscirickettsia salmonis]|uniref:Uncharacterized protein n=1 Tax=Piscirickettsia salmonis TaxID=1238 RepID=A0A9Q5VBL6_PISSA|nr:DUF1353 domain-containing protein [Piscirickettsia salmonis]WGZ72809.1 DUF1353 domain-containing protein [Piscirickettsia salmonis EM-90]ALA26038.1 hypothetical protein KW89_2576 [Piscirickettsia salmonis]APS43495.1 hypothetical protein AVI48_03315 [Piscirickettsia salmonis]APS46847.1 hypothetical protein AVI49_03925 [Piscirickettsia salmonis]APS51701.1 hypothetical protein AVI50_13275 [Piscirickettsia salmonis]